MLAFFRPNNLIDDDVLRVDVKFRQLLDQPLSLIKRQELRNADAYESRLLRISKLTVDFLHDNLHSRAVFRVPPERDVYCCCTMRVS